MPETFKLFSKKDIIWKSGMCVITRDFNGSPRKFLSPDPELVLEAANSFFERNMSKLNSGCSQPTGFNFASYKLR